MMTTLRLPPRLILVLSFLLLGACAPTRKPIPPGTVPEAKIVTSVDEQYGQEVLGQLTNQYQFDRNDARVNRVRDIVDRLTEAAAAQGDPWHVYVFDADNIKNAAATRGNYIFVWSGIVNGAQSDDELATVLAHEIGHVLGGHTAADPQKEAGRILAGVAGEVAGGVVSYQGGGVLADVAKIAVREIIQAMTVNPRSQADEFEADMIGVSLMYKAKYDPLQAVTFWERMSESSDFEPSQIPFFSSHPSSKERLERIRKMAEDVISGSGPENIPSDRDEFGGDLDPLDSGEFAW